MGLARSTYYDEPESQPIDEARLIERIKAVCAEWPAYGYRRVTAELRGQGGIVNHKKVMRLMKQNGIVQAGIVIDVLEIVARLPRNVPHQGRWYFGNTPIQTFLDAMPMTKEK
jgi:helix-turn-helix protein